MRFISQKITIIKVRKPVERTINQQLQWLGSSLGLFNLRDKNKSCFRIFIELLRATKAGRQLTSDQIAANLSLSRGTVIHHINTLTNAGLIIHEGNKYILRVNDLSELIGELEKDIDRTLSDLKEAAQNIDSRLNK
ncbi:ArsR family transcriptional regulator [Candidatus Woesearchaeota archaeon]|nr:ArsR family transcriptional regulator [Candidatus Woesearchaeota archaeon]